MLESVRLSAYGSELPLEWLRVCWSASECLSTWATKWQRERLSGYELGLTSE